MTDQIANPEDIEEQDGEGRRRKYVAVIDDREYRFERHKVTGRELMAAAGIPEGTGLVQILDDGTQANVRPDDVVDLKTHKHFTKAPTFRRG